MASATEPSKIAGYRIEGVLGTGGMSRVYVARQISLDRRIALKVFELGGTGGGQAALRLRREAHLLAKLDHENIVRCIDFGEADGYFYLALELVEGESLKQRLDRVGKLSGKDAARIAHAVGIALQHAHGKGVVHRDVKPGNVLLSRDGRIKLSDFGLARTPEDAEITQPGTALGTPQYLSPEQARSPRRANSQSDVYSLGATLYHMVAGVPPYQGDTLAEVITAILFDPVNPPEALEPTLDVGLSRIIARAMAKERTLRYRSALEFNADLFRWLAGQADTTVGISWEEAGAPAKEPIPRRAWAWGGLAAVSLATVIAILVSIFDRSEPATPPLANAPAFSIADVTSGRVSPTAAHAALANASDVAARSAFEVELRAEVERRTQDLSRAAESAARNEIAAGRFDNAFPAFERDVRGRVEGALGAPLEALPEPFARIHADALAGARGRVETALASARRNTEGAIVAELARRVAEVDAFLADYRVRSAAAANERIASEADATIRSIFDRGIREAIPGVEPNPDATWLDRRADEWADEARVRETRVRARIEEAIAVASAAIDAASLDPADEAPPEEVRSRVVARIEEALGIGAKEALASAPEIEAAIARRLEAFERQRSQRRSAERARIEASLALSLARALEHGDIGAARAALGNLAVDSISDPWLTTLARGIDAIDAAQTAALAELDSHRGQRQKIVASGVTKEGLLESVDLAARRLRFVEPAFEVAIADLSSEELERRAGLAATPLARALPRVLRGDVEGARAAASGHESEPWFSGLAARLDALLVEREAATRGEADAVRGMLRNFDQELAAGDRGKAALIAEDILASPVSSRIDEVKQRRTELERVRKDGRLEMERERKRAKLTASTSAHVEFLPDGRVRFVHRFDRIEDAADLVLPGSEWRVVDGRLSALSMLDRSDLGARIDLFRNRPGIRRSMPFEITSTKPIRVEFELILPLDPSPGLFGIRVLSTCFVLRTFPDQDGVGQVNGWQGDLDEFRDYLFDPALGETRPRKSGGGWRPYALERGNRYRCVVEGSGGESAEWSLTIEGDVVHRFRIDKEPRGDDLELRSEMPCEFDELILEGSVAGLR